MPQNGGMSPAVLRNHLPAIPAPAHARCGRGARPTHAAAAEGPVGRRGRGWGVGVGACREGGFKNSYPTAGY